MGPAHLSLYALLLLVWLAFRLLASRHNSPKRGPWGGKVACVVAAYNEVPTCLIACVASLRDQVDELWVVDDGSTAPAPPIAGARMVRFPTNQGKRAAIAHVLRATEADVLITVDSDTVVTPGSVRRLLSAFADPRVHAATGVVRGANRNRNLLTRLIDLRYAAAFLGERAAYSAFGSVLCCCGSLAAYRTSVVRPHVEEFVNQRFWGRRVAGGDDRRMTNYALLEGRAVLIEDARATTLVPERLSHFARQQIRWSRSFLRETLWGLVHLRGRSRGLAALELTVQLGLSAGLVVAASRAAWGPIVVFYLFWTGTASLARMSPALRDPEMRAPLWLAPLYGLLHLVLLMPLRLWAFATLWNGDWGTRLVVEIGHEPPVEVHGP